MGAARKLQAEIDRTLKKIQEGIEEFDQIWEKVHDTENLNQKEKFEADLKKEIKKLQRLRDQIKSWISGADIKDKTPLLEARKAIEREMERFKLCEKEAKMKAFSKAALGQADKLDPREQAKCESRDWINTTVDTLNTQIEAFEYEMEELQAGMKKKAKPPPRLLALEEMVATHKKHAAKLELALRCLDNDQVSPEEVDALRDDLEYYLAEDSEHYDNTEDLYAPINDRLEAMAALETLPLPAPHAEKGKGAKKDKGGQAEEDREREKERERERATAAAMKAQLIAQGVTTVKPLDDDDHKQQQQQQQQQRPPAVVPPSGPSTAQPSPVPIVGGMPASPHAPTPRSAVTAPPVAAPAAAVPPPKEPQDVPPSPGQRSSGGGAEPAKPPATPIGPAAGPAPAQGRLGAWMAGSPEATMAAAKAVAAAAPASAAAKGPPPGMPAGAPTTAQLLAKPPPAGPPAARGGAGQFGFAQQAGKAASVDGSQKEGAGAVLESRSSLAESLSEQAASAASAAAPAAVAPAASTSGVDGAEAAQAGDALAAQLAGSLALEGGGTGVSGSIDSLTRLAAREFGLSNGQLPVAPPGPGLVVLESCCRAALPQPSDSDWGRYRPRHPIATPACYPKTPPDVISNPALFRKMDPEALFFAFYYQPDTYQQYLAAQELKRQSWRYHKHHNAWFQRYAEPQHTTDEYEQGTYVYFDYNIVHDDMQTGWCYRRKENFTFRYDALEDELQV